MIDLYKYSNKSIILKFIIKYVLKVEFNQSLKSFFTKENVDLGFNLQFFYDYKKKFTQTKWMEKAEKRQHYQSNHDLQKYPEAQDVIKKIENILNLKIKNKIFKNNCFGRFVIKSLWFTIQKKNEGHREHVHPKSILTGVYYFQVDGGSGGAININFENKTVKYQPKIHDLLIFNSNLIHSVDKYDGKNDRIAVAWDAVYIL